VEPTLVTFVKPWGAYVAGDAIYADAALVTELAKAGVIQADKPKPKGEG
jgi:hypothetical protein